MIDSRLLLSATTSLAPLFRLNHNSDRVRSTTSEMNWPINFGAYLEPTFQPHHRSNAETITVKKLNAGNTTSELSSLNSIVPNQMVEDMIFHMPPKQQYTIEIEIKQIIKATPNLVLDDWIDDDEMEL